MYILNIIRNKYLLFILFSLISGCSKNKEYLNLKLETEKKIGHKIKSMIVVGFRDEDLDYMLEKNKLGGAVFFLQDLLTGKNRNAYSKEILLENMKKLKNAGIEFIAVDQEGGVALNKKNELIELKYRGVNRLYNIDNFNDISSSGEFAKMKKSKRKHLMNQYAKQIKGLGFSVNFVPVVDIQINKDPDFFLNRKHRLLGDNATNVAKIAEEIIDIYNQNGILTSIKHFPGHGSALSDTHEGFVDITNTWKEVELNPYKLLIKKDKVDMIMTGHLFNRNIDNIYPASISYNTITKLLREKLNYKGVIISDAIDMNALNKKYTLKEIVVNAINAGTDIILHANQMQYDKDIAEKIYNIILDNISNGKISEDKIHLSYERIKNLIHNRTQEKKIEFEIKKNSKKPLPQKIEYFTKYFLNSPYSKNGNEDLLYKIGELNCVTYFNAVISASSSKNLEDFRRKIKEINFYKYKEINEMNDDYLKYNIEHRRHFFILDTLLKFPSIFENITSKISSDNHNEKISINKKKFFDYVYNIKAGDLEDVNINYVNAKSLKASNLLKLRDDIYLIIFISDDSEIKNKTDNSIITQKDATHVGFLTKNHNLLKIKHASSLASKVIEIDFEKYLNEFNKKNKNGKISIWKIKRSL